ncbi:hypothetical protein NHG95_28090 [Pseudomonas corrugata]|uniref:hypothetical protein n=1 Tax=Pseudomonas corrugata TaxID=47879 RepID=UPI0028C4EF3C|nr:hypothetical protein [Pseudomonas corrugata]MDU9036998.1 hypothetical protein [Pseudomonas corrugata]
MNISTALTNDQFLTRGDFLSFWHRRPTAAFAAADVISAIEAEALRGCGCHWEIYEAVLLRELRAKVASLPDAHRLTFMQELSKRDIRIDDAELAAVELAEEEILAEIRAEQA